MTPENVLYWTNHYKKLKYTDRRIKNALAKEQASIDAKRNQKPVKVMTIKIEWSKSKTWGSNPYADADISYADGSCGSVGCFTCSGCGYDKESTVVADVCEASLSYLLYRKMAEGLPDKNDIPYGVHLSPGDKPYFSGGVGMSCYYRILEFLGGKLEHTASGKSFDVYKITINQ